MLPRNDDLCCYRNFVNCRISSSLLDLHMKNWLLQCGFTRIYIFISSAILQWFCGSRLLWEELQHSTGLFWELFWVSHWDWELLQLKNKWWYFMQLAEMKVAGYHPFNYCCLRNDYCRRIKQLGWFLVAFELLRYYQPVGALPNFERKTENEGYNEHLVFTWKTKLNQMQIGRQSGRY